ncbi:peptide-methionine (R)-S-oxide reductase MsrB [Alphaproteobacteria bacterium KMM 3653]|uniref:peptide-methionine (R)-S-oxide reductase n=1 Tax=Harenicola maris TaxID=2841044 RepID=A0AAP2CS52_9RHOB|nr:peptide-methionine (R)-S-oxide reductase MsrB [Harenicola maris]
MDRRLFLTTAAAFGALRFAMDPAQAEGTKFEVTRSEEDWRAMLSDIEYAVMREEKTERAGSSPLDKETRPGLYACKGCDLPLYSAEAKYDSGTGWPSFTQSLKGAVRTKDDDTLFARRTEVHCRRCGSHLGHIFDDGPAPTGKRHCLNGVSLSFKPA